MQVTHSANLPSAVSSRVESVTKTSLAKEFINTRTTIPMLPASSCTEYVPLNPIVTTKAEVKITIHAIAKDNCSQTNGY